MRKNIKLIVAIGVALLMLIILAVVGIPRNYSMQDEPSDKARTDSGNIMQAVYLEKENGNNIFVSLENDMPFRGSIPQEELYDENGEKISEQDLNNGDVLDIYGDGAIAESSPAQYPGITKIERTEKESQKYIEEYGHYLEELFAEKDPAGRPGLNVCYLDDSVYSMYVTSGRLEPFRYAWTYEVNGESQTIAKDAPHLLQRTHREIKELSEPMKTELMFSEEPKSVQMFSWDASLLGQHWEEETQIPEGTPVEVGENEKGNLEFTAQPGLVYLVQGQWENGTVDYGFQMPAE